MSFAASTTKPLDKTLDFDDVWQKTKSEFMYESEDLSISVPLKGKEVIEVNGCSFDYDFVIPKEFQNSKACNIAEDIIEFSNTNNDSKLEIKLDNFELEKYAGTTFTEITTAYSTTNCDADTLEYEYNLPQGYSLKVDPLDADAVCIVNENGEEVTTVTDFTAFDSTGQLLETYTEIKDDSIIQHYVTTDNTAFPIVVMAVSHPNRTMISYYTKDEIEQIVYDSNLVTEYAIVLFLIEIANKIWSIPLVGETVAVISFAGSIYSIKDKAFWHKVYLRIGDEGYLAKIMWTLKWHQGHRSYYPTGTPKLEIVEHEGD